MKNLRVTLYALSGLILISLLSGCHIAVLQPRGIIAAQEKELLITCVLLMLIIVIPTIFLSWLVAWRYRHTKKDATYRPQWTHSALVEFVCWAIPCIIILILAIITWISSHKLDPYRKLDNFAPEKTITIQAIALNWKWLFIYPDQHIATVNYVEIPVNEQIQYYITADEAPMNSLEMPQLAGQIYAMPGMRTQLHFVANKRGVYAGMSTNFSGEGFSGMSFKIHAVSANKFNQWATKVDRSGKPLNAAVYNELLTPSSFVKPQFYRLIVPNLFDQVMNKYMMPNQTVTD